MGLNKIDRDGLLKMYNAMVGRFGVRNWWPGESPLEICIGAILTQNTSWKNVEKAIGAIKGQGLMEISRLYDIDQGELAEIIRPAGYYNVKAKRLKNFINHVQESFGGALERLFNLNLNRLRKELLSLNGIGPETADSMILYAAGKPIFVVDLYTTRILSRHKFVNDKAPYDEAQALFHERLERDVSLYNDFHAQFVAVGNNFCKPKPKCDDCPLNYLP